jgi:hypothetical protein
MWSEELEEGDAMSGKELTGLLIARQQRFWYRCGYTGSYSEFMIREIH